jgi:hypothetical protein
MLKYRDAEVADVPAWPSPEKCSICDAVTLCHEAHRPARDLAADPEAYLRQFVVVDAARDAMKAKLSAHVRAKGEDLRYDDVGFGTYRKPSTKSPICDLYDVGK